MVKLETSSDVVSDRMFLLIRKTFSLEPRAIRLPDISILS